MGVWLTLHPGLYLYYSFSFPPASTIHFSSNTQYVREERDEVVECAGITRTLFGFPNIHGLVLDGVRVPNPLRVCWNFSREVGQHFLILTESIHVQVFYVDNLLDVF